ncbi:MAG: pyridoxal-dependent decarboxylase [Pirellulaceae bacterium]
MDMENFREWAVKCAEWGVSYRELVESRPVRSSVSPGEIRVQLPALPPEEGETFQSIFNDFERIIMPGITHWQHPNFFAYFPANAAPPSVLAEMLVANLASQCMIWQTSPAASELEEVMIRWLGKAVGLPNHFGVIEDTASTATLGAIMTMRERAFEWQGNELGLSGLNQVRVYASSEVHSSIDRAIWVAGIGQQNLVRVPINGENRAIDVDALRHQIVMDQRIGMLPAGIVICFGGTSCGSTDNIEEVQQVAREFNLYTHVDAAWAGSAMICDELRENWNGIEDADSIVFNPHKWLGAQFDCSIHFVKDRETTLKTLAIHPEYLKTYERQNFVDFCEMTIPLGRKFRALKLWFLLRSYGLKSLREKIRNHIQWARDLSQRFKNEMDFELVTEPQFSLFTFRYHPEEYLGDLDELNQRLVARINDAGSIYLSSTRVDGKLVIRFQVGQFDTKRHHVMQAGNLICETARRLSR